MPVYLDLLAASAVEALDRAGLHEVGERIARHVVEHLGDQDKLWMEIILLEVRDIARRPHLTRDVRADRIEWVLHPNGW